MNNDITAVINQQQLGKSGGKLRLTERDEVRLVCQHLCQQARRTLHLFTYDMDASLFDQVEFLAAVKQLAVGGRSSQIRILLQNNEKVQSDGHRLLEMARRLTSKIEIRTPHSDHIKQLENYLVVDESGYLFRPLHYSYHGEADFNDRYHARGLDAQFLSVWECSEQDSMLRRLYL